MLRLIFEGEGKNHIHCGSQQNMDSGFYSAEYSCFFLSNEDQPMYIKGNWEYTNINLLVYPLFPSYCYKELSRVCITSHFISFIYFQSNF